MTATELRLIIRQELERALRSGPTSAAGIGAPVGDDDEHCVHVIPGSAQGGEFIYFVRALSPDRHVKIGRTRDLANRMSSLQNGCPYRMVLAAFYWTKDAGGEEGRLHEKYAARRVRGEWFLPCDDLEREIAGIAELRRTAFSRALRGVP